MNEEFGRSPHRGGGNIANADSLTGLPLPKVFLRDLEKHLLDLNQGVTILFADFDHFRDVNSQHGVVLGDELLRALAFLFTKCCADFPPALSYRFGGTVFDVILPGKDPQRAKEFAESVRAEVERFRYKDVALTVSIGIATAPHDGRIVQELADKAYGALQSAKKNGRNRVEIASRVPQSLP